MRAFFFHCYHSGPMLQPEGTTDTTTLDYWLNLRVLLCSVWVLTSVIIALYIIWRYEGKDRSGSERVANTRDVAWKLFEDEVWMPCLKGIHPCWLLAYRFISLCLLLATLIVKVNISGGRIYYYYTQWTFTLLTIYFGLGTLLSIYGCLQYGKIHSRGFNKNQASVDAEQGLYVPLNNDASTNTLRITDISDSINGKDAAQATGKWSDLFQVIFQTSAGAVVLTDCVYWFIIFPYFTIKDYSLNFLTVNMHTTNAVFLLGEAVLNRLPVPWFRISYFLLWTAIFVIFQWTVHACISTWWPYPFLDLSLPYAPLWYLLMGLMHIPSYGIFSLLVEFKQYMLSKWFSQSFQRL